jgi:RimJ/RimL family protein N-acetyltransferase
MLNKQPVEIHTPRFLLRSLNVGDVNERYAGWLNTQIAQQYITAAASSTDIATIRRYLKERHGREDVLFLGIFDKSSGEHIGNIKYEPVNSESGYAIMGILIGELEWRGKGVASEVLLASGAWLNRYRNIERIILGVSRSNTSAIRAYEKAGFIEQSTDVLPIAAPESMSMVWHLEN